VNFQIKNAATAMAATHFQSIDERSNEGRLIAPTPLPAGVLHPLHWES